jgi:hypothetical protein
VTSQATSRSRLARRASRPTRSIRSGSTQAPSASRIPAPPSVVALPPIPSTIRRGPASRTARSRSPVPTVVAPSGSRSSRASRESPEAAAISTIARLPSVERSHGASIGRPIGSTVGALRTCQPPPAAIAARVPSPPSARGARSSSSSGRTRRQPSARARATSIEVSEPLNESGAKTTVVTPRSRPPASRGIRGSGSSAGAPGRPARSPRGPAGRARSGAASSSSRARRTGAPCAAPRAAS